MARRRRSGKVAYKKPQPIPIYPASQLCHCGEGRNRGTKKNPLCCICCRCDEHINGQRSHTDTSPGCGSACTVCRRAALKRQRERDRALEIQMDSVVLVETVEVQTAPTVQVVQASGKLSLRERMGHAHKAR